MAIDKAILLVEDNPDEEALTLRAIRKNRINAAVNVAHDGVEALNYIFPAGDRTEAAVPWFVILDLKLPRVDGFDVIERLRADPRTRLLPIVVFSSSTEGRDINRCYELGANGYIAKPVAAEPYQEAVELLVHYWFRLSQDPYLRK